MKLKTLEDLFYLVIKISKIKNEKDPNFRGRDFWQPIKEILATSDYKASKWKKQSIKKYNKIMNLTEYFIDGYGNKNIIKTNHFLIQTFRIPYNEKPTLRKIIQVALNIGQYQGTTGKKNIKSNIQDYLIKSDYNINLNDILEKKELNKLEKYLSK